jgi:hypothetical protein
MLILMLNKDTKQPWSPQQSDATPGDACQNTNKGFGGMSTKEFQDHLERLKNNVRAEVPDCNCFPPDKCKNILLQSLFRPFMPDLIGFVYLHWIIYKPKCNT